jgi:hypothetical protein
MAGLQTVFSVLIRLETELWNASESRPSGSTARAAHPARPGPGSHVPPGARHRSGRAGSPMPRRLTGRLVDASSGTSLNVFGPPLIRRTRIAGTGPGLAGTPCDVQVVSAERRRCRWAERAACAGSVSSRWLPRNQCYGISGCRGSVFLGIDVGDNGGSEGVVQRADPLRD